MAQIIQICKFIFLTVFFFVKPLEAFSNDLSTNEYGNYLSWEHAKKVRDLDNLKRLFKLIEYKRLDSTLLEEVLFESVVFDDWNEA